MSTEYTPPTVGVWNRNTGGKFANINRPTAGATHDKDLPRGQNPLQLYSLATPNGVKVTVMLEELLAAGFSGAEYDAWLINIGEGDQFGSGFVAVNPNSKIPALLDVSTSPATRVFESGSILVYLAEKFGCFLPRESAARAECLSWLFWQMGSTPYLGDVLDQNLATRRYVAGEEYSIADMAIFPWYGGLVLNNLYNAAEFLEVASYSNVVRWASELRERPAVQRGQRVNRTWGPEELQVRERHSAADFR